MGYVKGTWGTGDWEVGQRPQNWREGILYEEPNGDVPLTALSAMMKSKPTDDYIINWFEKTLATQGGAIVAGEIYTDSAMAVAYTTGGVAGTALYVKVAAAVAGNFRPGHQALLRCSTDYTVDVNVKVTGVTINGASSQIAVRLLEADDNGAANSHNISNCDTIMIIGNINPQGGAIPQSVGYTPTSYSNYTQIFRTRLNITRTALQTKLRTGSEYNERKREAALYHAVEQENARIWGIKTLGVGDNGEPETTLHGLIPWIKLYASSNVDSFCQSVDYAGATWLEKGEEWLDSMVEQIMRYGPMDRLVLCGSGALLGINKLIKSNSNYQLQEGTIGYGIKVMKWITPFGVWNLKRHPLFSYQATNRHSMVVLNPSDIIERPIQPMKFFKDSKDTTINYDGLSEEFLTELSIEYHFPLRMGYLEGVGLDSRLV